MSADKGAILNMKYNLPDRILREIVSFAKEHSITKIILFGSRARIEERNKKGWCSDL